MTCIFSYTDLRIFNEMFYVFKQMLENKSSINI
ncbi:hypothetical protein FC789_15225 [Clostridium botulinum]|nr:hypothetical protein [Clostridium botulinum]